MKLPRPMLHVITDRRRQRRFSHAQLAAMAAEGGADFVQFREKRPESLEAWVRLAREVAGALRGSSTLLIVNDSVEVALRSGAAGVHLGPDDPSVATARRRLGPDAIIGATANDLGRARSLAAAGPDYLGVGPVFGTRSKERPAPTLGPSGLAAIVEGVERPVIAIGNMSEEHVPRVFASGAAGIAVLSAVVCAEDPRTATRRLRQALDAHYARGESLR